MHYLEGLYLHFGVTLIEQVVISVRHLSSMIFVRILFLKDLQDGVRSLAQDTHTHTHSHVHIHRANRSHTEHNKLWSKQWNNELWNIGTVLAF